MPKRKIENIQCISLTVRENNILFRNIGHNCTSTATAIVELHRTYGPKHDLWFRESVGILCFIRDERRKFFFLRLYNLEKYEAIWEFRVPYWLVYVESDALLHQFQGKDCIFAFNFSSEDEAKLFYKTVSTTLERFAKIKRKESKRHKAQQNWKNTLRKIDISGPTEYRHVLHYGLDKWKGLEMNLDCLQSTLARRPKNPIKTNVQTWPDIIPHCYSYSSEESEKHVEYNDCNGDDNCKQEHIHNESNQSAQSNFLDDLQNAAVKPHMPSSRNRTIPATKQVDSTAINYEQMDSLSNAFDKITVTNCSEESYQHVEYNKCEVNRCQEHEQQFPTNFLLELQNATLKPNKPTSFTNRQVTTIKQIDSTANGCHQMASMKNALDKIKLANFGVDSDDDDDDYTVYENDSDWDE